MPSSASRIRPTPAQQRPPPAHLGEIVSRLRARYLPTLPAPRRWPDPLAGVLRTILAQQNTRAVATRQWEALTLTYPVWEAALLDGPDGIEATLRRAGGGLTRIKANYLYGVLAALEESRGELSLRFLHDLSEEEARAVLEGLPGVGQRTASLVLLFDLVRPAMPVDTNIARVAARLDLVPGAWSTNRTEVWFGEVIPRDWETRYALHLSGVRHGHETCTPKRPLCGQCVLRDLCPSAALFVEGEASEPGTRNPDSKKPAGIRRAGR